MIEKCELCDSTDIVLLESDRAHRYHWKCKRCKEVEITDTFDKLLQPIKSDLWLLSAYCREQFKNGLSVQMIHRDNLQTILEYVKNKKPRTLSEGKNRVVKFLGDNTNLIGLWIKYDYNTDLDIFVNKSEMDYLLLLLFEENEIEADSEMSIAYQLGIDHKQISSRETLKIYLEKRNPIKLRLSSLGRKKYDEFLRNQFDSNKAFIAMWFNESTQKLREALKLAVGEAGYDPIIIDEREFTGNIMDYVLVNIRQSKFLIADFTVEPEGNTNIENNDEVSGLRVEKGVRGGVYYEAGFAKGLGLKVIHTCKNNYISKNRLHFDVAQDNTIFWKAADLNEIKVRHVIKNQKDKFSRNLSEQVFDRILATVGPGALYKQKN